ncbi:hypothetical protein OROGR_009230 [Orobanche gracilis]
MQARGLAHLACRSDARGHRLRNLSSLRKWPQPAPPHFREAWHPYRAGPLGSAS